MARVSCVLSFLFLDVLLAVLGLVTSSTTLHLQNYPLPAQRHGPRSYHVRARLVPARETNSGETNSFHNPHLGSVLHARGTPRHYLRSNVRSAPTDHNSNLRHRGRPLSATERSQQRHDGSGQLHAVKTVDHSGHSATFPGQQPTYRKEGNTHHLTIPIQRNSRTRISIPIRRRIVQPVYTLSAGHSKRQDTAVKRDPPPDQPPYTKTFRFNIPLGRKYHVLATTLPYDSTASADNLVTDPADREGVALPSTQKALFHVRLEQPAVRVSGQRNHPVSREKSLRRTTLLPSRCIKCPPDQTVVVERGKGCATVVLPPIKACSRLSRSPGTLEAAVTFGPSPGNFVAEGEYALKLHILKAGSKVHTCQFRLSVQVRKCSEILAPPNGLMHCTNGTAWGSTCHFTCPPGYELVGSVTTSCEGDVSAVTWTSPPPTCQEGPRYSPLVSAECAKPTNPLNGLVHCEPEVRDGWYPEGATCRFFCEVGYEIPDENLQNEAVVCRASSWNIGGDVECLPIRCLKPPVPRNGRLQCQDPGTKNERGDTPFHDLPNYAKGTVCHYQCDYGHVIPTSQLERSVIECRAPFWNNTLEPECRASIPPAYPATDCDDKIVSAEGDTALVPLPRFTASDGTLLVPSCTLSGLLRIGHYANRCEVTDPELRMTTSCTFSVTVKAPECDLPPDLDDGHVTCDATELGTFPVSTVCEYSCQEGYVIPTSKLHLKALYCGQDLKWNSSVPPECLKRVVPEPDPKSCRDQEFVTADPNSVVLHLPKFQTVDGRPAEVKCTITKVENHGSHENLCQARDLELRTQASCRYNVVVRDIGHTDSVRRHSCDPLTAPTHGRIRCRSRGGKFRCHVKCGEGMSFHPSLSILQRGFVECDQAEGVWDFQREHALDNLPDCLGVLPTVSVQAPLKFKAEVGNCSDYATLDRVMTAIKDGLLTRNQPHCTKIHCSDFTYMCAEDKGSQRLALETTWTIQGSYKPDDDYGDADPEVDTAIEEVQTKTQNVLKTDREFKKKIQASGADLWESSFHQDPFILGCGKAGYVLDPDTTKCFECPTGTIEEDGTCQKCPGNHYQDQTGQTRCKPCPRRTTSTSGSRSRSDCQVMDPNVELNLPEPVKEQPLAESTLITACDSNPCVNSGTCIITRHSFRCLCKDGFRGRRCEHPYCPPYLCMNGGSCSLHITGVVGCMCPPDFTGSRCESRAVVEPEACKRHSCKNGGQCRSEGSKPSCKCLPQFTGDHCEYRSCSPPFKEYFCLNGGTCGMLDNTQTMVCICSPHYMGTRCEYPEALLRVIPRRHLARWTTT